MPRHARPLSALSQLAVILGWGVVAAGDGRTPVVFVPGTGGSQLAIETVQAGQARELYWITPGLMEPGRAELGLIGLDEPAGAKVTPRVVAPKVLKSLPMKVHLSLMIHMEGEEGDRHTFQRDVGTQYELDYPVYGKFAAYSRDELAQGRWFEVPYDWRKGACDENSRAIDKVVDDAIKATGSSQVILLAPSLGGLVCRDYVAQDYAKGKVKGLVAVGTPWLGALKAARGLLWGYNFGLGCLFDPIAELRTRPPFLYAKGSDPRYERLDHLTRVSVLDPDVTRRLAGRYPAVYEQLPTYAFMKYYGRAINPPAGPTSVFLAYKTPEDSILAFEKAGPALYKAAQDWRDARLRGNNHGLKHFLVGATCPEKAPADLHTDMKMARPEDLSTFRPEEIGRDMKASKGKGAEVLAKLLRAFSGFGGMTREDAKGLADDLFDINPFFRDLGNAVWITTRSKLFETLRDSQQFPVYLDNYLAVDHSPDWGDSTSPLLGATAGAILRRGGRPDGKEAEKFLGKGFKVAACDRSIGYDHSNLLDDPGVRLRLEKIFESLNGGPDQP